MVDGVAWHPDLGELFPAFALVVVRTCVRLWEAMEGAEPASAAAGLCRHQDFAATGRAPLHFLDEYGCFRFS